MAKIILVNDINPAAAEGCQMLGGQHVVHQLQVFPDGRLNIDRDSGGDVRSTNEACKTYLNGNDHEPLIFVIDGNKITESELAQLDLGLTKKPQLIIYLESGKIPQHVRNFLKAVSSKIDSRSGVSSSWSGISFVSEVEQLREKIIDTDASHRNKQSAAMVPEPTKTSAAASISKPPVASGKNAEEDKYPDLISPISHEYPSRPVTIIPTNIYLDITELKKWVEENGPTCPITHKPITGYMPDNRSRNLLVREGLITDIEWDDKNWPYIPHAFAPQPQVSPLPRVSSESYTATTSLRATPTVSATSSPRENSAAASPRTITPSFATAASRQGMFAPRDNDMQLKISIVGDMGVGKSNLLSRYADEIYRGDFEITSGSASKVKSEELNNQRVKLQIWDAKSNQDRGFHPNFRGTHGVLLCFDLTNSASFEVLQSYIAEIKRFAGPEKINIVLVGTKVDQVGRRVIERVDAENFAAIHGLQYIETSAKNDINVAQPFRTLAAEVIAQQFTPQSPSSNQYPRDSIPKLDNLTKEIREQFCTDYIVWCKRNVELLRQGLDKNTDVGKVLAQHVGFSLFGDTDSQKRITNLIQDIESQSVPSTSPSQSR